ncbi:cell wall elongation regulator TseB-like domain-containing protein [Tepidibacillus decaturensis]|uniref:Cell wall elongation regulator TseB-like domain-containing protein n=1 Tax=Tepidibacillus decaturensis TaxID=1413211 RepID=A0A135L3Z6_9BACI|nr:DUF5590 domain-containing protein [Tepidibacillus decaturensis]KXG43609.1 hypothetical protein U473_05960 [Tepidibacillus decaturensis]
MKKFIIRILILLIILLVIVFAYFYRIWAKEKKVEEQMVMKARQEVSILDKIDEISYFTGEKQYYVIMGKDHLGIQLIIWLNEKDKINYQFLTNWVKKEEIEKKALSLQPNSSIKRITPGIMQVDRLIYEVLFKDDQGRFGYQYFDLKTGELIKMYLLGK